MKNKIIITILTILVIGLSGYLVYDKFINVNKETKSNENTNNDVNSNTNMESSLYTTKCNEDEPKTYTVFGDVDKYSNIYQYLLAAEDVSIKVGYCSDELESDGEFEYYKTNYYNLTKEEVNTYLNEMKDKSIPTYVGGGHGMLCDSKISITYKLNNTEYSIEILRPTEPGILSSTDANIYKIIDKVSEKNEETEYYCLYAEGYRSQVIENIVDSLSK